MGLRSMCVPVFCRKKVIDGVTEKNVFLVARVMIFDAVGMNGFVVLVLMVSDGAPNALDANQ